MNYGFPVRGLDHTSYRQSPLTLTAGRSEKYLDTFSQRSIVVETFVTEDA
jgi:hypothetical protein